MCALCVAVRFQSPGKPLKKRCVYVFMSWENVVPSRTRTQTGTQENLHLICSIVHLCVTVLCIARMMENGIIG